MQHKQQYARAFCDGVVDALTNGFIANISQCKPISEVGAEQMLLDTYALRNAFTDLPSLISDKHQAPQPAYAKRVAQTVAKADPLLKTLQVRPQPPEALIQAYLIHVADGSESNFKTILDLKGIIKKQEQTPLIELFNTHKASHSEELNSSASIFSHLSTSSQIQPSTSSTPAIPNLASGKFDAASFGTALFSAAKDGVDRFGSPVSHAAESVSSAIPSRVASPPGSSTPVFGGGVPHPANLMPGDKAANLNDNLKNIGKFFRRDSGAFPKFGAKAQQ